MPSYIKVNSEYHTSFKPQQSYKSASFIPTPEQQAPTAGVKSQFVKTEPPLQSKKRTPGPATTLGVNYYQQSLDDDAYYLLGNQDKFAKNVRYRPKSAGNYRRGVSPPKQQKLEESENIDKENLKPKYKPPPKVNTEKFSQPPTPLAPRKPKDQSSSPVRKIKEDRVIKSKDSKQEDIKGSQKVSQNENIDRREVVKQSQKDKIIDNMNEFVQTNMEKGVTDSAPEAPADYAFKYKTGIAAPRPAKKGSEYMKEFRWKDRIPSSPLLDAEQMIYKSSTHITPKKDIVPKVTEYQMKFKPFKLVPQQDTKQEKITRDTKTRSRKSKLQKSKSMEDLSPAEIPTAGSAPVISPDNRRLTKESEEHESPKAVPKVPKGVTRKFRSEYKSNFRAPGTYSYDEGAWRGAQPPHLKNKVVGEPGDEAEPVLSTWFAEVIELRRKANEYRKRAQGTHFSREHLLQLLARQADMWDASTASTARSGSTVISTSSLESVTSFQNQNAGQKTDVTSTAATQGSEDDMVEHDLNDQDEAHQSDRDQAYRTYNKKVSPKHKTQAWADGPASDEMNEEEEEIAGRLPTPEVRKLEAKKKIRRHHLDLTTPVIGGALLTSPPEAEKSRSRIKSKPKKAVSMSWAGPFDEDEESIATIEEPVPKTSGQVTQKVYDVEHGPVNANPTFGMPSRDTHILRDDDASIDRPMQTQYVYTPLKAEQSIEEQEENPARAKSHSSRAKRFNPPSLEDIKEGFGQTYKLSSQPKLAWTLDGGMPVPRRDDDVLSLSARSVASSSSLASEVYERARKRKDEFWGKEGIATK
ncbi:hypothetical protein CHS0354_017399 [Potamilus streckersoni]|uniref:Nuclear protein MDM1 n=1 Tax=Potamilus streckersoni TaxID=2493646 RepID=A0AAE0WD53_9BIVA|nr:hypothetical protein CHS0354_017399 [Potamilus streckersoni]